MRHRPFPELVTRKPPYSWEVVQAAEPNAGACDITNRRMLAPKGDDHISTIVRAHELGHAAFPLKVKDRPDTHPAANQIAADIWTAVRCARRDVQTVCECDTCLENMRAALPGVAKQRLPRDPNAVVKYTCMTALLLGPDAVDAFAVGAYLSDTIIETTYKLAEKKTIVPLARYLTEVFDLLPKDEKHDRTQKNGGKANGVSFEWPEPKWITLPLTDIVKRPRTRVFGETGVPIAPHRMADETIACNKLPSKTVSVLFDTSSSMRLSDDDLRSLIKRFPSALAATYSDGYMAIVVRDGRMVHDVSAADFGGWNTTDLPSLRWLARQRGPRYWITDGGANPGRDVCGEATENITDAARDQCRRFCWRNGITMIPAVSALENKP